MATPSLYAVVTNVPEAATLRIALPGNTAKRLARLMNMPIASARCWLARGVSASRRREVALRLLLEMDRQDVARHSVRRVLVEWAGGNAGVGALVDSVVRDLPLAAVGHEHAAEDEGAQGVLRFTQSGEVTRVTF